MEKEKKKITLMEIGPARVVMLLMAGIFLVLLSIPNLPSSDKKSKQPSVSSNKLMGQTSGTANDESEL